MSISSATSDPDDIIHVPPVSFRGYLLGLLVIAVTVAFIGSQWPTIPDSFATHFGGKWRPDAWSDKSLLHVFGMSLLNLGLTALLAASVLPFTKLKVYARNDPSEAGKKATGTAIAATATALGWFAFALVLGLSALQIAMVLPKWQPLIPVAGIMTLVVSIAGTIAMIAYVMTKVDKVRAGLPRRASLRIDENFYKGGMFYFNPDDPARVVDKRGGLGVDFNYAHAPGKIFMAGLLLLCLAPLLLLFF